jgi:polar amino acid transport system ATP-binding protein
LFDEPTSALNSEIGFAKEIANRIIILDEGKILEKGTLEEIFNKQKTKDFLSKV